MSVNPAPFRTPTLMLVTGLECIACSAAPLDRLVQVVVEAVRGGVSVVQLREKDLAENQLLQILARLRDKVPPSVPVILNAGCLTPHAIEMLVSMALLTHQHTHTTTHPLTFHLPEHAPRLPAGITFGRSVHSVEAAWRAEQEGASYLVAGSIFPTTSHPGGEVKGLPFLKEVCRAVSIPVLAIGGILPERVEVCLDRGAAGVAVRSPILSADSPQAEAARFLAVLHDHRAARLK